MSFSRLKSFGTLGLAVSGAALGLAALSTWLGTTDVFDLSVNFQTAQRMNAGQRLYQDFSIPNGPLPALTLLPLARLFSPGWALLISSALLNTFSTALVFFLLWQAGLSRRRILVGSLLTAVWFLPPMGAFYHDHLAYTFVLLAFTRLAPAFSLVLAFHAKQTIGLPATVILVAIEAIFVSSRSSLKLLGKILLCHGSILALWAIVFHWDGYFQATFTRPADYFGPFPESVGTVALKFFKAVVLPYGINPIAMLEEVGVGRLVFFPAVFAVYFVLLDLLKNRRERTERFRLELGLILTTLLCGALLGRTFSHLFFGLGAALALTHHRLPQKFAHIALAVLFLSGLALTMENRGMLAPKSTDFRNTSLWPLTAEVSPRTSALATFLARIGGEDYYLTDNSASLLPLALARPPLNSTLDYHDGTTIPVEKTARLAWQHQITLEIARLKPRYVVVTSDSATHYKLVMEFLRPNYQSPSTKTLFSLYERRSDPRRITRKE
ncbi:MAG: hypothetical protein HYR96_15975 [Deltaproteobacteria bacterium]|nr:hypothetical protein [Deltaproteobacteria bacterium]MBI3293300.1 hypothetical protein [Deltaproteobacteria bacterium]